MAASKDSRVNQLAVRPRCTTANIRLPQDVILRHTCCILSTVFIVKRKQTWCNRLHRNSEGQRGLGKINKIWDPNMNKASRLTLFNHHLASTCCRYLKLLPQFSALEMLFSFIMKENGQIQWQKRQRTFSILIIQKCLHKIGTHFVIQECLKQAKTINPALKSLCCLIYITTGHAALWIRWDVRCIKNTRFLWLFHQFHTV